MALATLGRNSCAKRPCREAPTMIWVPLTDRANSSTVAAMSSPTMSCRLPPRFSTSSRCRSISVADVGRGAVRSDDVHGDQRAAGDPAGDPGAAAEQHRAFRAAGQRDHDPVPGGPGSVDAVLGAVPVQAFLDPVGDPEQGQFAQRGEVAFAEVVAQRGVDPFRRVDVPVRHPPAQRLRGHVDQFDLFGGPDHLVGDGLGLFDAGDRGDHVVEGFQVLDVHRGDHVDAGVEQLIDVLPTLLVRRAGGVGVRQFVDQHDLGMPGQDGVGVHLGQLHPAVARHPAGDDRAGPELLGGELPAVGLVRRR